MGRRGPSARPTALKLLRGERADRINDREPIPRDALPQPPEGMSSDVRAIWDYTLGELVSMGIACAADRDSLVCYCEAVVTHRKASEIMSRTPVIIKGLHGGMVRNPVLAIQRDAAYIIRQFAQEFGLTPSGRTRIQTEGRGGADQSNPFAVVG